MSTFSAKFFAGNRERLTQLLPNSLILISANAALQYSADVAYPFRQDSNFWYLTGLNVADAVLAIDSAKGTSTILFAEQNEYQKEWDGQFSTDLFAKVSGIDNYGSVSEIDTLLKNAKKQKQQVYYQMPLPEVLEPYGFFTNPARRRLETHIKRTIQEPLDIRLQIARMRMIKQPAEMVAISQAIEITAKALENIKKDLPNMKNEHDIAKKLNAEFYQHADGHSFSPIIAGGKNAATIHYESNDAPLNSKELVLVDVGASFEGYAADISRVWSIGGKPSQRQQDIWQACLAIQEKAFQLLKPGVFLREYQETVEKEVERQCQMLKCSMAGKKYPHGFSHFMGIDVHDAGDYASQLGEGMVLTVEPGIYLADEGIGVRVEDDVVITKSGIKNLSASIPKTL